MAVWRSSSVSIPVCLWLVAIAACAPARPVAPSPAALGPGGTAQPATASSSRTLVIVIGQEPDTLAGTSMFGRTMSTGGRRRPFNAGLALRDAENQPLPYLAEVLPQLNTESWRVFPDGRMETIYRLRPNLVWHDGAPLGADDFVFAWQVYATPQLGQSGTEPINMIQDILAPDPRTVVIHWRSAYAEAGALESVVSTGVPTGGPSFSPLPRHILARPYEEQRESFLTLPFWTVEFVGAGPFRVEHWETGAFIDAVAFDQHALGRPKFDRLKLIWNTDTNAVLARLLSGDADFTVDGTLGVAQALVLRQEWEARGVGTVRFVPKNWRYLAFQHRPEYANPRAILDVRVREALARTVDRKAMADGLYQGVAPVTDFLVYPTAPYFAELDRAIAKYPFDPRRAEALLQEAGYRKGADSFYESPAEGHLQFQVKGASTAQNASERSILASDWRQASIDVEEAAYTASELQNGQLVATFRSMYGAGSPAGIQGMGLFTSGTIPTPENHWVGGNRGGWSNPDYDHFMDLVQSSLEPTERGKWVIEAARVFTEQVAGASLYFLPNTVLFPALIRGMDLRVPDGDETWNIYQWELAG